MADPAAFPSTLTARSTALSVDAAAAIVRQHWSHTPRSLTRLATERDDSFRLELADGARAVLKIAHPADPAAAVDAQLAVLADLAAHSPALPVSRVLPTRDGAARAIVDSPDGPRLARMLSWLEGEPWNARPRSAAELRTFGTTQATLAHAVAAAGTRLPAALAPAPTPWNLLHIDAAESASGAIHDAALRTLARAVLADARTRIHSRLAALPRVLNHNDAHGENVLVAPPGADPGLRVTGLLDFGDMTLTPRVADLAVAASYAGGVADPADPEFAGNHSAWAPAAALVAGAAAHWATLGEPLSDTERALIAPLVLLRLAQRAALNSAVAAANAERAAYASRNLARLRVELETLTAHPAPDELGAAP